ncbi:MAG TPA: anti-sigma factor [Longimicrobium sp.]|jgi:hypothetical protein
MSLDTEHENVQAALAAEALDALDGEEREALHAHLAGCAECRAELESLREAASLLAHTAPHVPLAPARSDRIRARLLARAAADVRGGEAAEPVVAAPETRVIPIASRRRSALPAWLAAAASVLIAIGLGAYALSLRGRVSSLEQQTASLSRDRGRLESTLAEREATLAALAGPEVRVITLASTQERAPSGRMFWNPVRRRYTFFAYNLPQVRPGREYQLWLITPAGPVAAPTFRPGRDGAGSVEGAYDVPNEQIRAVAVTEEPAGGLPKPTGEVLIVGNAAE